MKAINFPTFFAIFSTLAALVYPDILHILLEISDKQSKVEHEMQECEWKNLETDGYSRGNHRFFAHFCHFLPLSAVALSNVTFFRVKVSLYDWKNKITVWEYQRKNQTTWVTFIEIIHYWQCE